MTETQLKEDVRQFTQYTSTKVLSTDGLDTAYRRAQKHLRVEKGLPVDYNWFNPEVPEAEDALFWYTCLFCKVETGELDSQAIQAGAVDVKTLLAKDNNEVTTWYRNAVSAKRAFNSSSIIRSSSPARTDRDYTSDSVGFGDGTSGSTDSDLDI